AAADASGRDAAAMRPSRLFTPDLHGATVYRAAGARPTAGLRRRRLQSVYRQLRRRAAPRGPMLRLDQRGLALVLRQQALPETDQPAAVTRVLRERLAKSRLRFVRAPVAQQREAEGLANRVVPRR